MSAAVGCFLIDIPDQLQGAIITTAFLYPASGSPTREPFGPYSLEVARDAPANGDCLRLVVLSHGNSGSPWTLRETAAHLAQSGFVVALPEHPGNSRSDNSLAGTAANLENRPRHISMVIDAAFAHERLGKCLMPNRVGVIGTSIGGYTALAVAGGQPWAGPHETDDGKANPVKVVADPRVRAIVLLAPATPWFMPERSLSLVNVPILMRTGSKDEITPAWHADLVNNGVPDPLRIDHQIVPGAGHFSFLSEFPPEMKRPDFPPSNDPEGFDRKVLQPVLQKQIVDFLNRVL